MQSPKICLSLTCKTLREDVELIKKYRDYIDIAELRVDHLSEEEQLSVRNFPSMIDVPCILTIRRVQEGGAFSGNEFSRTTLFARALAFADTDPSKNFAYVDFETDFNDEELECKCSEENPDNCLITPEIQDMIDEILMYPRIIVPIILIVTGIYNFAKAAFANKEDEMKKYQKKFFKQLLIGVMVFFIPTLINIIIDLSQYVWDGLKTCSI